MELQIMSLYKMFKNQKNFKIWSTSVPKPLNKKDSIFMGKNKVVPRIK